MNLSFALRYGLIDTGIVLTASRYSKLKCRASSYQGFRCAQDIHDLSFNLLIKLFCTAPQALAYGRGSFIGVSYHYMIAIL